MLIGCGICERLRLILSEVSTMDELDFRVAICARFKNTSLHEEWRVSRLQLASPVCVCLLVSLQPCRRCGDYLWWWWSTMIFLPSLRKKWQTKGKKKWGERQAVCSFHKYSIDTGRESEKQTLCVMNWHFQHSPFVGNSACFECLSQTPMLAHKPLKQLYTSSVVLHIK